MQKTCYKIENSVFIYSFSQHYTSTLNFARKVSNLEARETGSYSTMEVCPQWGECAHDIEGTLRKKSVIIWESGISS